VISRNVGLISFERREVIRVTMPLEYSRASADFDAFMSDLRTAALFDSNHSTYTMLDAVFQVFRRRLSAGDGLAFATALPPVLRSIFVAGWTPEDPPLPVPGHEALFAEIAALRPHHNFSPPDSFALVAEVLRRHVDVAVFDRMLDRLPKAPARLWRPRA
jgi:uncharacterized protein (DUF2267 family)